MKRAMLWLLAWGAAARITRFITDDDLAEPLRQAWTARLNAAAGRSLQQANEVNERFARQGGTGKSRRAQRLYARFTYQSLLADPFLSCPWCIGQWTFGGVAALAWLAATRRGGRGRALGGPAWFTVPAFALAGNWLYAHLAVRLDPDPDKAHDAHGHECPHHHGEGGRQGVDHPQPAAPAQA